MKYPMDQRIADANWDSAMRYARRLGQRNLVNGMWAGGLLVLVCMMFGLWITR